jgi:hypothetical protein
MLRSMNQYSRELKIADRGSCKNLRPYAQQVDTFQEENVTRISLSHWNYKALIILHQEMPDVM